MTFPGGVRGRLMVAFVLVAAVAAGSLAIGAYLLVLDSRMRASVERAEQETRFALDLAAGLSATADLEQFVESFGSRDVLAVVRSAGRLTASRPGFEPLIPEDLDGLVAQGLLAYQRTTIDGGQFLVSGGRPAGSDFDLFLFLPESMIQGALEELRNALVAGWIAVVLGATLVGRVVATRTLAPVSRAASAAREMASGHLDTRLAADAPDEFGAWAAAFNEMADALADKIAALTEAQARERRFTADVAHELRTPLTALVTEASLLEEHLTELPEAARHPAELLVADVARLRRLVDDLLEISRFDAAQEGLMEERFDLGSLSRAVLRSRGWEREVTVTSMPVVVHSDRRRVERILANLVGNAVIHGRRDVRLVVGRDGTGAFVEVSDRGAGIPPEHLPHLFERFYKAHASRSGSGSGLGLAIAAENAALIGGHIEVWSEPGTGARFTLRLPVTELLPHGDVPVAPASDASSMDTPHGETR